MVGKSSLFPMTVPAREGRDARSRFGQLQREMNRVRSEQSRLKKEKIADQSGKGDEYMAKLEAEAIRVAREWLPNRRGRSLDDLYFDINSTLDLLRIPPAMGSDYQTMTFHDYKRAAEGMKEEILEELKKEKLSRG